MSNNNDKDIQKYFENCLGDYTKPKWIKATKKELAELDNFDIAENDRVCRDLLKRQHDQR